MTGTQFNWLTKSVINKVYWKGLAMSYEGTEEFICDLGHYWAAVTKALEQEAAKVAWPNVRARKALKRDMPSGNGAL